MSEELFDATETEVDLPQEEFVDSEGQDEFTDEVAVDAETEEYDEPDLFEYDAYADKGVRIKVDGEEVIVPLKEALAGYQRQADYTRKTQELSKQRQEIQTAAAIQEALVRDPAGTISLLQQHYGVNAPQVQAEEDDIWVDPMERELRELKAWKAELEYEKTLTQVEREIQSLEAKYGEDFDREEVIAKALASGSTDLEATFKLIQFDKVYAERTAATRKVAENAKRTNAKKSAQVVQGGTSVSGTTSTAPVSAPKSVADAFADAARALGL